jgi:hypothetical protein
VEGLIFLVGVHDGAYVAATFPVSDSCPCEVSMMKLYPRGFHDGEVISLRGFHDGKVISLLGFLDGEVISARFPGWDR